MITLTLREVNEVSIILNKYVKLKPYLKDIIDSIKIIIDHAIERKVSIIYFDPDSDNPVEKLILGIHKDASEFLKLNKDQFQTFLVNYQ